MSESKNTTTIEVAGRAHPPDWAVKQRYLITQMNNAAIDFVERYTRPDGTLVWRDTWPGMDGSDDGYESFMTFPLLYVLGGADHLHELAREEWNAITWQFTEYGQVWREYDAYYDWMHHGESSTYIYYFGLADPYHHVDRTRALRFAAMYTGDDPDAPNWDPVHKLIRSPINGSRGPCMEMTPVDWVTHRPILANYLSPYEDVPGFDFTGDPLKKLDWNDEETFAKILKLMNERMVPGDVPLNLNSTSLITSAYMYTGDEKYKTWVLEYLDAWRQRAAQNNGIVPDNVGPTGIIGERMGGKWWGGYYGWRWPHGAWTMLEATLIAGCNATLLTGDPFWLDLHRSQNDLLFSLQRDDGTIPYRYSDSGWLDYRPPRATHYIHVWNMSRDPDDWTRLVERFPDRDLWYTQPPRFGKSGHFGPERWFGYVAGENPDFPDQVLEDTYTCMTQRLDKIENDNWDELETWDVHHWQDLNPVVPEGLVQMMMGTPAAVYHGGLLHASVRYFAPQGGGCDHDHGSCSCGGHAEEVRPGLPVGVAALVERITPEGIVLALVNTDPLDGHDVIVQAGTFGEHRFTTAKPVGADVAPISVNANVLRVSLGPWSQARLELGMQRFTGAPTYEFPVAS